MATGKAGRLSVAFHFALAGLEDVLALVRQFLEPVNPLHLVDELSPIFGLEVNVGVCTGDPECALAKLWIYMDTSSALSAVIFKKVRAILATYDW
jgi:hypothetical protein